MTVRQSVKHSRHIAHAKGSRWTRWELPILVPGSYALVCCDCGLTHHVQLKIVTHKGKPAVAWRIARADLYTQMHRHKFPNVRFLKQGEGIRATANHVMVAELPNGLREARGGRKVRTCLTT